MPEEKSPEGKALIHLITDQEINEIARRRGSGDILYDIGEPPLFSPDGKILNRQDTRKEERGKKYR